MTTAPDLWHHYGRARALADRAVPETFSWAWSQEGGPGTEVLGDLTDRYVGDLGAGAARHAAHLSTRHRPARVDAVDASAAQHAMAGDLYGHLAPRLRIVRSDAVDHLHATDGAYDVLYSVFGAVDFTDPRALLPTAAAALRPGGRLVFSTLAHYLGGAPAQPDVAHADIPARTPDGETTTMRRWVLQEHVWIDLLSEAGFTDIGTDLLPACADAPRSAGTLLVTASARPGGVSRAPSETPGRRRTTRPRWPTPPRWTVTASKPRPPSRSLSRRSRTPPSPPAGPGPLTTRSAGGRRAGRVGMLGRAEDVLLCVSELTTNALLHGVPPGRGFLLHLSRHTGGVVRVEVHDSGDRWPRLPAQADGNRAASPEERESGRGLLLVDALADKWDVGERVPGKVVRCEFAPR